MMWSQYFSLYSRSYRSSHIHISVSLLWWGSTNWGNIHGFPSTSSWAWFHFQLTIRLPQLYTIHNRTKNAFCIITSSSHFSTVLRLSSYYQNISTTVFVSPQSSIKNHCKPHFAVICIRFQTESLVDMHHICGDWYNISRACSNVDKHKPYLIWNNAWIEILLV